MSEDKLKNFIDNHREEFDDFEPRDGLWDKIELDLPRQTKMVSLRKAIAVAASVLVVISTSLWMGLKSDPRIELAEVETVEQQQFAPVGLSDISPELAEIESYYIYEVNSKLAELDDYTMDEDYKIELDFLQEEFENLKIEMGRGAQRQKILEAMIENYRLRLEILEDLLEELKEQSNEQNIQKVA